MTSTEEKSLSDNIRIRMRMLSEYFSDFSKQIAYKDKVPFVHIPEELVAQWNGLYRHSIRKEFSYLYTQNQLDEMRNFDRILDSIEKNYETLPDVPEIHKREYWVRLKDSALILKHVIES